MKVLFVVFEFQNRVAGGLGRVINGLSPELARLVELHVLAVFRHPLWLHQLQLHHFPGGGLAQPKGPPVLDSPGNFARLVLAEGGYDVVHFFYANEAIMTSKANVLRAAFPETKLVFSIHNLFKHEHPIRPCGSRFLRAEEQLLGLVDHVHVLNHASKRIFEQTYPEIAATRTLSVIHNGIEGDTFRASDAAFEAEVQRALPQGAKLVVCLSRWAPGKGLEHLLAAMAELCSERDDVYLAIAGRKLISWEKGSFGYVRRMDRMLAKLGRRVLRFGWLGEAQRNALFALAEVAVMPSELEYFPYGSTEPLHENVPLVQSRLPCLEEFFEDGVHCFFFEPRNVRDLAARLRWVLRDRAAARRMGAAGGQRLRSLSSWAVIARQYRAMYEQLERRGADAGELSPMLETEAEPIAEPLPELMRGAEPMKALLISFEFGEHVLGGLGRVINGLTAELRQAARLDIYLLYFDPRRLAISAKVYRCSSDRYGQLIETFTRGYDKHCVELIRREAYDIVHFFSVHWIIGKIIQRVSRELPAQKIVYSIHSLIKYEAGTRKNPSSFFECEEHLIRSAHVLHVLNGTSRDYLARAYAEVAAHKPLYVIPNGVRASDALPRDDAWGRALARRLRPRTYTVVCLSRWAHGKGLEHFVRAARRLLDAGHDIQFVLAGRKFISWEMQWYAYVAKISIMAWGLGSRCTVLGWLTSAQRNSLFAMADAVVVPSELEYYPYAVLEPAAAGVPLICSNLPCVAELLRDGEEYLAFESKNAASLAEKIVALGRDRQGARQMAERARRRVIEVCDWKTIADDYARLYRDVTRAERPQTLAAPA